MRAAYLTDECVLDESSNLITLMGEECDHLVVTRISCGDELLVLDGRGHLYQTRVLEVKKKKFVQVKIGEKSFSSKQSNITLGLGIPKREALERSVQIAQEFNLKNIIPLECEFTQFKSLKEERLRKILTGALKQSNSPYLTNLEAMQKIDGFNWSEYDKIVYLDPYAKKKGFDASLKDEKILLLVGPEGGFSSRELELIGQIENLSRLKICDTILRVETCVASALGYLHHYDGRE